MKPGGLVKCGAEILRSQIFADARTSAALPDNKWEDGFAMFIKHTDGFSLIGYADAKDGVWFNVGTFKHVFAGKLHRAFDFMATMLHPAGIGKVLWQFGRRFSY